MRAGAAPRLRRHRFRPGDLLFGAQPMDDLAAGGPTFGLPDLVRFLPDRALRLVHLLSSSVQALPPR
jgi:hypothetical protein